MIVDPALDEKEFRRIRKELLTALQTEYADPMTLAGKHFQTEVCGKDHPSGRTYSIRSVKALSNGNIRDYYTRFIAPRDAVLIVAGDFDIDAMRGRYEPLFNSWTRTATEAPRRGEPLKALTKTVVRCIDKPDLSQTTIVIGHPTVGELHEAKNCLMLGNYILGGGNFSSRLMARIRSRTGNTYGISSQVMFDANYGIFMVSTTTRNHHLKEVMEGIITEYRELMANGVTVEELQKARQFALGNLAFELEGVGNVVEKLLWLRLYHRENSYLENYPQMIEAIDADAVNAALANHLNSPHFVISAVGRADEIRPIMEPFGEIHPYDYRAEP
jgi:zinc protease